LWATHKAKKYRNGDGFTSASTGGVRRSLRPVKITAFWRRSRSTTGRWTTRSLGGEHLLEIPPVTDLLARIEGPPGAAVFPAFVAIPQQIIAIGYRVNNAITAGEYVFEMPSVTDLLARIEGPPGAAVFPAFVAIPQQIIAIGYRVNNAITAGEYVFEMPSVTDLLARIEGPPGAAVFPAFMAVPQQIMAIG
jgi:hypothetical protein